MLENFTAKLLHSVLINMTKDCYIIALRVKIINDVPV